MNTVIRNGRLIDPANKINKKTDLYISKGRVVGIGAPPCHRSDGHGGNRHGSDGHSLIFKNEIDATGLYILPGLVDLCARAREPGEEHKATIRSETYAAISAGITRMVTPPDTYPIVDNPAMAHMIQDRAEDAGFSKIHPLGALTVGLKGEKLTDMAMLMDAGCVGVTNALQSVENTLVMRRAMQYASTYDIPVFINSKDPWLQGNGVVHEGEVSTRLGLPAIPEAAETVGVARDLALIETSGASAHFCLLSCGRSVNMIAEAQQRKLPVTASVSINHLLCSENDIGEFDTQYKVLPPFRTEADRLSLIEGVKNGQIAAICSDHQPHGSDAKLVPFSEAAVGIAGIETLLSLTMNLVNRKLISLNRAVSAITIDPAKIIGIDAGHLSIGAQADLCLFDPKKKWVFDKKSIQTNGRNSPFLGKELKGKVAKTLVAGKTVYNAKK